MPRTDTNGVEQRAVPTVETLPPPMDVLYAIFDATMPRQGPGSDAATRRAWAHLEDVPPQPRVLDIGCGTGMQTRELARLSGGRVLALDNHHPYLRALQQHAAREGVSRHIAPVNASMMALPFAPATFDVIWSEGALYIIGFAQGLATCRPLLKPGGYLVVSEITWFTPEPAPELRQYWQEEQVVVCTVEANLQRIVQAGYRCVAHMHLPTDAWWDDFYTPMCQRMDSLRQQYRDDPARLEVINQQQREVDLYRAYPDQYGYEFYVMQRT